MIDESESEWRETSCSTQHQVTMAFIEHMVSDLAVSPPTSPFTKDDPEKLAAPRHATPEQTPAPKFELGTESAIATEPATLRLEPSSESLDTAVAHGAPTTMLISLATQAAGKSSASAVNVAAVVTIQRAVRRRRCVVQRRIAAAVMCDDAEAGQRELLVRSAPHSGLRSTKHLEPSPPERMVPVARRSCVSYAAPPRRTMACARRWRRASSSWRR